MSKRITRERIEDYHKRIKRKFKLLGDGAFARVYQHPRADVVVKVFDASEDSGYTTYLKWASRNQKNPYVPRIYGIEKFKNKKANEEITVVFLEKLKPATFNDLRDAVEASLPNGTTIDPYLDDDELLLIAAKTNDKHLKAFIRFMNTALSGSVEVDLHSDNFMFRPGTKQLVFTDPLA